MIISQLGSLYAPESTCREALRKVAGRRMRRSASSTAHGYSLREQARTPSRNGQPATALLDATFGLPYDSNQ